MDEKPCELELSRKHGRTNQYEAMTMKPSSEQSVLACNTSCGTHADLPEDPVHVCRECHAGCTASKTEHSTAEEISAGPYLVFSAILIVLVSVAIKWLL
jgi:hypothetical protein